MSESLILLLVQRIAPLSPVNNNSLIYKSYLKSLNITKSLYSKAYYWHGTGRYHYKLLGKSKYEGVNQNQIYDVLESIITSGGLIPAYDPFNGVYAETASLTPFRMYARCYAEFNSYLKTDFKYTYGSGKFWYVFLLFLQINAWGLKETIRKIITIYTSPEFKNKSDKWFRSVTKNDRWSMFNIYNIRSDIPVNYGLLFGIKRSGVNPVSFNKAVERFETRSNRKIELKDITHIEVPFDKIRETADLLKRHKVKLSVMAIEDGEIYCSQKSLKQLVGIK